MNDRRDLLKILSSKACISSGRSDSTSSKPKEHEPCYVCTSCERTASNRQNLCRPMRLYSTW